MFLEDSKYEFMVYKNMVWLKLFYHEFAGGVFENDSEAISSSNPQKFSILNELNDNFKYREKFQFLLQYKSCVFRWLQSVNPLYEDEDKLTSNYVNGFKLLEGEYTPHTFGGLARTRIRRYNEDTSLLDGNPKRSYWFFAIGMKKVTTSAYDQKDTGIPGSQNPEPFVKLWVKVPFILRVPTCGKRRILNNSFINVFLLFFSVVAVC